MDVPMLKRSFANLLKALAIVLLLSSCFFISLSNSITVPSDSNVPAINPQIEDLLLSDTAGKSSGAIVSGGQERSYGGSSGRTFYFSPPTPQAGDPIQIRKYLVPSSNGYLLGDTIGVFVEISCKARDLNSLHIKEFLSEGINLVNISKYCYRLVDSNEIRGYEGRSNEQYFMDFERGLSADRNKIHWDDKYHIDIGSKCCILDLNNLTKKGEIDNSTIEFLRDCLGAQWAENGIIHCSKDSLCICNRNDSSDRIGFSFDSRKDHAIMKYNNLSYEFKVDSDGSINLLNNEFNISIDEPRANYRYAYWYFVRSNSPGNYKSITHVITSGKEPRDYPDTDSSLDINVNYPRPEVNLRVNKLHLLKNEELNVVYEINFNRLQRLSNIRNIKFKQISDYYKFVNKSTSNNNDNKMDFKENLNKINNIINKTIVYPNEGEYYLPPIWIDDQPYLFQKEKISVEKRFTAYAPFITLIFAIISFLMKDLFINFVSPSGKKNEGEDKTDPLVPKSISKPLIKHFFKIIIFFVFCLILMIFWLSFDKPILLLP